MQNIQTMDNTLTMQPTTGNGATQNRTTRVRYVAQNTTALARSLKTAGVFNRVLACFLAGKFKGRIVSNLAGQFYVVVKVEEVE
jgi:hypothetical protein